MMVLLGEVCGNLFYRFTEQGSSIKDEHDFDDENQSLIITKIKCKAIKDATRSIKLEELESLMMALKRIITRASS